MKSSPQTIKPTDAEAMAVLREHGFIDFERPWLHEAAVEASRDNGPYSDYAGWERWMDKLADEQEWFGPKWDEMDSLEKIGLYSIMSDLPYRRREPGEQHLQSGR